MTLPGFKFPMKSIDVPTIGMPNVTMPTITKKTVELPHGKGALNLPSLTKPSIGMVRGALACPRACRHALPPGPALRDVSLR